MDLIATYGSDDELPESNTKVISLRSQFNITTTAPVVQDTMKIGDVVDFTKREIQTNPTADVLWQPLQTVNAPWTHSSVVPGQKNTVTGFVEDASINDYSFDFHHHQFQAHGRGCRER
jgi:hypothetical protein